MNLKKYSIFLLVATLMFSCSKDGETGPQGIQGPQGLQGPQGIQGVPGQNGTKIYSGSSNPQNDLGIDGDYYLNLSTQVLFGPKDNNIWSKNTNLKGKDGDNGKDGNNGNTILNGYHIPSVSLGQVGDFYIDISTMDLYGPKTFNSWGAPVSLKSKASLTKRVLIKENFEYSMCDQCYNYSTTWLPGYSSFSATSAYVRLNVGDIQEYYEKGSVTYEARINGADWFLLDPSNNKEIIRQFKINNREYLVLFVPPTIQYSHSSGQLFFGASRDMWVPGVYSMNQLITWLNQDVKIDLRITLLPGDDIEYISKVRNSPKIIIEKL